MKNLTQKLVFPLLIVANSFFPSKNFSQEKLKEEFVPFTYLPGRIGVLLDSDISEKYGALVHGGLLVGREFDKNFRVEGGFGITYGSEKKTSMSNQDKLFLISFFGNVQAFNLKSNESDFYPYLSAGIIYDHVREEINEETYHDFQFKKTSYDVSGSGLGISVGGGLSFILNKNRKTSDFIDEVSLEALYESVSTERLDRDGVRLSLSFKNRLLD